MVKRLVKPAAFLAAAATLVACGERQISLDSGDMAKRSPIRQGAEIFADKCAGCHTIGVAGTQGSAVNVRNRERTDGPNFNTRKEDMNSVLYAIRNGGFSGAIMPENIVVGRDAQLVAQFLAKYAGRDIKRQNGPNNTAPGVPGQSGAAGQGTPTNPGQATGSSSGGGSSD